MDSRTQDLRRHAAQGCVESAARLLRERVRAGDLDEGRLRVAAWCGDAGARLLAGDTRCPAGDDYCIVTGHVGCERSSLTAWLTGLLGLGAGLDVGDRDAILFLGDRLEPEYYSYDPYFKAAGQAYPFVSKPGMEDPKLKEEILEYIR